GYEDDEHADQVDEVALRLEERRRPLARPASRKPRPDRQRADEREEDPVASRELDPPPRQESGPCERGERNRGQPPGAGEVAARRDADHGDGDGGREPRQQPNPVASELTPASGRKRGSPHPATVSL